MKDGPTKLVLPELDDTTPLPVITEGGLSGCFLAHCLFVDLPNRKLPKLVSDNWQFDEVDGIQTPSKIKQLQNDTAFWRKK